MPLDTTYLQVSDGSGDAALMHVTADRLTGSTTIQVDITTNIPEKFIATSGTLLASGFIDPATITNFYGHLDTGNLEIDGFLPGSVDDGNTEGQVVVIKPNTAWADFIATFVAAIAQGNGLGLADISAAKIASEAWTAYTPVLTGATTNPTVGNGSLVAKYYRIGRLIMGEVRMVFGTTSVAGSGAYTFTLPVAATALNDYDRVIGNAYFGGGGSEYVGRAQLLRSNHPTRPGQVYIQFGNDTANPAHMNQSLGSGSIGWADGYFLDFQFCYEAVP